MTNTTPNGQGDDFRPDDSAAQAAAEDASPNDSQHTDGAPTSDARADHTDVINPAPANETDVIAASADHPTDRYTAPYPTASGTDGQSAGGYGQHTTPYGDAHAQTGQQSGGQYGQQQQSGHDHYGQQPTSQYGQGQYGQQPTSQYGRTSNGQQPTSQYGQAPVRPAADEPVRAAAVRPGPARSGRSVAARPVRPAAPVRRVRPADLRPRFGCRVRHRRVRARTVLGHERVRRRRRLEPAQRPLLRRGSGTRRHHDPTALEGRPQQARPADHRRSRRGRPRRRWRGLARRLLLERRRHGRRVFVPERRQPDGQRLQQTPRSSPRWPHRRPPRS